jgi:phospholipase/carboxylesterase
MTDPFSQKLDYLCLELLKALEAIERSQRRFFPPTISRLQEELLPFLPSLNHARQEIRRIEPSHGFAGIRDTIDRASGIVAQALEVITTASRSDMEKTVIQVLQAFRKYCQAQEQIFRLRRPLPAINRFFLEPEARARLDELDPDPPPRHDTGLHHVGADRDPYARGSYSMYVPESYDGSEAWPLVIALHGGFGHGRDFLWTWLREARSRRFLLLAPTSTGTTWSLLSPEVDGAALTSVLEDVTRKWNVDSERMLLTGISDGGTFALVNSLQDESPFSAFAVIAGVLPPADLRMARGKRIFWAHGALDWMFPVKTAQRAATMLEQAGADITLRVIHDLSHAYPRDQNARILEWFDPALSLSP